MCLLRGFFPFLEAISIVYQVRTPWNISFLPLKCNFSMLYTYKGVRRQEFFKCRVRRVFSDGFCLRQPFAQVQEIQGFEKGYYP